MNDRTREIYAEILNELGRMSIIDCHEHLPGEAARVNSKVSALTLFSHYCRRDLATAGLPEDKVDYVFDESYPFEERWTEFAKYYPFVRNTAYTRAAHIALRKFYGEDELTAANVEKINSAMAAANRPGLYRSVLSDACNIITALTQGVAHDAPEEPLLTKVIWAPGKFTSGAVISQNYGKWSPGGVPVDTLARLEEAALNFVSEVKAHGAVGVKFFAMPFSEQPPDRAQAGEVFAKLAGDPDLRIGEANALTEYILDLIAEGCAKAGLVVCLHTGYWGDFRKLDPAGAYPFITRHRGTRFDLYHVGYPYVREAVMLAKLQPNVWTNMCWTYIISPKFAHDALTELLETVPHNKILGFGGDYRVIEKVYGHLVMARETIARVLAEKVAEGLMTNELAVGIAEMMLRVNPENLYDLPKFK